MAYILEGASTFSLHLFKVCSEITPEMCGTKCRVWKPGYLRKRIDRMYESTDSLVNVVCDVLAALRDIFLFYYISNRY